MKSDTKIGILIPAYNAAKTLPETLHSIRQQPHELLNKIEKVVIVDDCSSDNTIPIAKKYWPFQQPKLELKQNTINKGERNVCNEAFRGLCKQNFDWCLVLHADDIAKPNWLEATFNGIAKASQPTATVCSSWDNFYEDGRIEPGQNIPDTEVNIIRGTNEAVRGTLNQGCWWHFSGCAMHLPTFLEVGLFDEQMPQLGDLDWLIRALKKKKDVAYIPQSLILYRQSSSNVSSISFKTNRDLSEGLRIGQKISSDAALKPESLTYVRRLTVRSIRRGCRRLCTFNLIAAQSAFQISLKSLALWRRMS